MQSRYLAASGGATPKLVLPMGERAVLPARARPMGKEVADFRLVAISVAHGFGCAWRGGTARPNGYNEFEARVRSHCSSCQGYAHNQVGVAHITAQTRSGTGFRGAHLARLLACSLKSLAPTAHKEQPSSVQCEYSSGGPHLKRQRGLLRGRWLCLIWPKDYAGLTGDIYLAICEPARHLWQPPALTAPTGTPRLRKEPAPTCSLVPATLLASISHQLPLDCREEATLVEWAGRMSRLQNYTTGLFLVRRLSPRLSSGLVGLAASSRLLVRTDATRRRGDAFCVARCLRHSAPRRLSWNPNCKICQPGKPTTGGTEASALPRGSQRPRVKSRPSARVVTRLRCLNERDGQ